MARSIWSESGNVCPLKNFFAKNRQNFHRYQIRAIFSPVHLVKIPQKSPLRCCKKFPLPRGRKSPCNPLILRGNFTFPRGRRRGLSQRTRASCKIDTRKHLKNDPSKGIFQAFSSFFTKGFKYHKRGICGSREFFDRLKYASFFAFAQKAKRPPRLLRHAESGSGR